MRNLLKCIDLKLWLVLFLASGFLLTSESDAHARFMKKIAIDPLENPREWKKPFKPGKAFSIMLEKSLVDSGQFEIVQNPKFVPNKKVSSFFNKKEGVDSPAKPSAPQAPSSQYQIRGRVLMFDPNINTQKEDYVEKEVFHQREKAKIEAVIELVNLRTGRLLAKKSFASISNDGRMPFNRNLMVLEYETHEFKQSSIGIALWKLNSIVEAFIIQILNKVPLEGDLILVDQKNKSAVINLGQANGVLVKDVFMVFSMKTSFNDPLNQTDLGEKYTRKGVIKILEVQGRFSRAQIMVGLDLAPGDLVVPKLKKSTKQRLEDGSMKKGITWGAYQGLSSLSY